MLRFYFVIIVSIFSILYFLGKAHIIERTPENYTMEERYDLAKFACNTVQRNSRVTTNIYGTDKLPKDSGFIMYPNHQGKYDAVGLIYSLKDPCSFVVDSIRSKMLLLNEVTFLVNGKRLDKSDIKGQIKIIQEVADEVADGRRYIIFPEGGYEDDVTDNTVKDFMPGAFKAATKAKCPIVPVALIDSYPIYRVNSIKRATCEIHYLDPIYYDEYKDLNTHQIAEMVKEKIENKINEVLSNR